MAEGTEGLKFLVSMKLDTLNRNGAILSLTEATNLLIAARLEEIVKAIDDLEATIRKEEQK
jgi:hypothetical protein